MLDTPTHANFDDFRQRFRHTYGFLVNPYTNNKDLVYLKNVGNSRIEFQTATGAEGFVNIDSGVMFEFLPITRGWFATRNGPVLLQRIPAKQYQRGISLNNTSVKTLTKGMLYSIDITIKILQDIFINNISDDKILSRFFMLSDRVWFLDTPVGVVEDNIIKLDTPVVFQEIKDAVSRKKLNYQVVMK